jgi:hypothetical protein
MKSFEAFERIAAFRETFLLGVPASERETYHRFGQILYNNSVEIGEGYEEPKRGTLKAALADLEHLEEVLAEMFKNGSTGEFRERRLDEAAGIAREKIREVVGEIRKALGMKLPSPTPEPS